VSVGLNVLEYVDGAGEVDRVGTGGVMEETGKRPGLTCDGGGADVSGATGLDTVLARPREKTNPGRDGRDDEGVAGNAEGGGIAACGRALDMALDTPQ